MASAKDYPGEGYDLVAFFDCLHDMGDPVGAMTHVRETIADDGTVMLVEPFANGSLAENLNPVGRVYYAASTVICTPSSLDQEVGLALGRRPARSGCARWPRRPASAGSAAPRRRPSTSCWKRALARLWVATRAGTAVPFPARDRLWSEPFAAPAGVAACPDGGRGARRFHSARRHAGGRRRREAQAGGHLRRQQLGRHRGRAAREPPAGLPARRTAQHHPRLRRADGRDPEPAQPQLRPHPPPLLRRDQPADRRGQQPVRGRHVLVE